MGRHGARATLRRLGQWQSRNRDALRIGVSALTVASATIAAATDVYASEFDTSASTASAAASTSVCQRYPDTRRANVTVLVLSHVVSALAFTAAHAWLYLQGAHAVSATGGGQQEASVFVCF